MLNVEQLAALPEGALQAPCPLQLSIGQALCAARALDCADTAAKSMGLEMNRGVRAEFESLKAKLEAAAILALVALNKADAPPT